MVQILHGSARTTEAMRREIQNSQESLRTLSERYAINQKTVAKWIEEDQNAPVVENLFLKDSLYFSDADREAIVHAIARTPQEGIVLTHGTGTMKQTAGFLASRA